jgi:protoheme IX farnesyltransferase
MSQVKQYLKLCKINLSLFSALSAATGYMLVRSALTIEIVSTSAGVFLLACGSCALNQYQERRIDALMERTKNRPIPSGRIKPLHALYFSFILLISGVIILFLTGSLAALLLGVCAVLLYNGVYTPLKKKTAFASVPCAVIGSIPPAIGWTAGGGRLPDHQILAVCFLFYIWQITHFLLLFLSHGDDYRKAGLPSLTDVFSQKQLVRIVFVWIFATAVTCMMTPLYGLMTSGIADLILIAVTGWLLWNGVELIRGRGNKFTYHFAFNRMNIYILLVMLLLDINRVI